MVFTLNTAIELKADHLTKSGGDEKLYFTVKVVQGRRFLPLTKTRPIGRVLCGDASITGTTIVETIRDLRNDASWKDFIAKTTPASDMARPKKRQRDMRSEWLMSEDKICVIEVPEQSAGLPATRLSVLLGKPGRNAPYFECTQENLQYLHAVAMHQTANAPPPRSNKCKAECKVEEAEAKTVNETKGISYIYNQEDLVGIFAKRTHPINGKRTKTLSLKNLGSVQACVAAARAFLADPVESDAASSAAAADGDSGEGTGCGDAASDDDMLSADEEEHVHMDL